MELKLSLSQQLDFATCTALDSLSTAWHMPAASAMSGYVFGDGRRLPGDPGEAGRPALSH